MVQPFATLMVATDEKFFNEMENMDWSVNQQLQTWTWCNTLNATEEKFFNEIEIKKHGLKCKSATVQKIRCNEINKLIIKLRKKFVKTSFSDIISQDYYETSNKLKWKEFVKTSFFIITSKGLFKNYPELKWERTTYFDSGQPFATLMNATAEK